MAAEFHFVTSVAEQCWSCAILSWLTGTQCQFYNTYTFFYQCVKQTPGDKWTKHIYQLCYNVPSVMFYRRAGTSTTRALACRCVPRPSFTTSTHSNWSPTPMPSTNLAPSVWPSAPVSPHTMPLHPHRCTQMWSSFYWGQFLLLLFS